MTEEKKKGTRPEPEEGPNGVDRWTSNGYGIEVTPPKKEIDDIEEV